MKNRHMKSRAQLAILAMLLLAASSCAAQPEEVGTAQACHWPHGCNVRPEKVPQLLKVEGRAKLPADTFAGGQPSASKLGDEINGRKLPFEYQPVQGFSAVLGNGHTSDTYWVMTDNGYGTKAKSSDFLLRMYLIHTDFEAGRGSSGDISVEGSIQLRDPDQRIPFPITNDDTEDRLLTGADFDPESVRRDIAGDLWFGDEYGPFLLHTDATGRVLEAPFPLPGVSAPENPYLSLPALANLPSSKGFEGMSISEDGRFLYPMLGGALATDPDQRRRFIYQFHLLKERYTGERWQYHTDDQDNIVTDLSPLPGDPQHRLLLVERSSATTDSTRSVKIYLVDLHDTDASGFLIKHRVLTFPNAQIESVMEIGAQKLLLINDNDYPFTTNDTEAIVVKLEDLPGEP